MAKFLSFGAFENVADFHYRRIASCGLVRPLPHAIPSSPADPEHLRVINPHGRPREAERSRTPAAARDLKQTLATNLRRLRIARGLTQSELGAKAGITRAHLNRLERGAFNASLDTVSRLAAALGVAPLKLLKMPKERR